MARKAKKQAWHGTWAEAHAWVEDFVASKPDSYYGYARNLLREANRGRSHVHHIEVMNMAALLREKHSTQYQMWRTKRRVLGQSVPRDEEATYGISK